MNYIFVRRIYSCGYTNKKLQLNNVWLRTTRKIQVLENRVFDVMHLLHNFAILGEKLQQKQMTDTSVEIGCKHGTLGVSLCKYITQSPSIDHIVV